MNFNNQEMQDFFNGTSIGKRLVAAAKKEQAIFDTKLNEIRGNIDVLNQNIEYATYGTSRNVQKVLFINGNPVAVQTDNRSRVVAHQPITNENFEALDDSLKQSIKQNNPTVYQRLNNGAFTPKDSDSYYLNLARAEANLNVDVLEAYATAKEPHEAGYVNQFENAEDMERGVLAFHKWHNAMSSDQNIADLHSELSDTEIHLEACIKSNEIVQFDIAPSPLDGKDSLDGGNLQ